MFFSEISYTIAFMIIREKNVYEEILHWYMYSVISLVKLRIK